MLNSGKHDLDNKEEGMPKPKKKKPASKLHKKKPYRKKYSYKSALKRKKKPKKSIWDLIFG